MPITTYAYANGNGHISIEAKAEAVTEIMVYGYIGESFWEESTTARDVVSAMAMIGSGSVLMRVLSRGGAVADGVAIYNAARALAARGIKVTTRNEGEASSIAGLILMAGDTVETYANATFMVHAPWAMAAGNADDLRNAAEYLDKLAAGMATSYARKTGKGDAHALALMTNGKDNFFTAAEALAEGFVDAVIDAEPVVETPSARAAAIASPRPELPVLALAALFPDLGHPKAAAFAHLVITPSAAQRGSHPEHPMPASNPAPAPSPAATQNPAVTVDALAANRERIGEIRALFAAYPQARAAAPALESDLIADDTVTAAQAGKRILEALAAGTPAPTPTGGMPRTEAGADERDHLRAGMENALLHRANPQAHKIDERGRKFQGMNLVRMAEASLQANNIRESHVPGRIAARALHSTSDFPFVLENVVTKTLRAAYEGTMRSFTPWTRRAVLPDFKEISRVQLGGAPTLKRIVEGGEYEQGTIGEGREKYRVQKYGRLVNISWETIVNDDLGAFTRVPEMFGRSAADLESDIVYAILTANAALSDTVALFDAAHGNLGTAGVISDTTLSEGREKMLLQKGIEGRYITVRPEFLIVPPQQLTLAQKILGTVIPESTANVNIWAGALTPIVEPRLQDASDNSWYLAASPNAIDTIEYAYLEGYEGVFTETKQGFEVDGVMIKCRHVFGAKAIDYRGLFKNVGA